MRYLRYLVSGLAAVGLCGATARAAISIPTPLKSPRASAQALYVLAVNNAGEAVGFDQLGTSMHPLRWSSMGAATDLRGDDTASTARSAAYGINDKGWAIGADENNVVIWKSGSTATVVHAGVVQRRGELYGADVNEAGEAIARVATTSGPGINYHYAADGTRTRIPVLPPGVPPTPEQIAQAVYAINNLGQWQTNVFDISDAGVTVGYNGNAFVGSYGSSATTNLPGGAGHVALGINEQGWIVGTAGTQAGPYTSGQAVMWRNGQRINLNTLLSANSGWVLRSAVDISETGWVVGNGTYNGVETGYLINVLPEPATVLALALPTAVVLRRRARCS